MKNHLLTFISIFLLLMISFLSSPNQGLGGSFGGTTSMPFGGRVLTPDTPGIECPRGEATTIRPVGAYPPLPYVETESTESYGNISENEWILGTYRPSMDCYIETPAGPVPAPSFNIQQFGSSSSGSRSNLRF